MRYKCPRCGAKMDGDLVVPGRAVVCPACNARLKPPGAAGRKGAPPVVLQPIVLQTAGPSESSALQEEQTADLRERRLQRREDRGSNTIGGVGFALNLTTLVFLLSGAALREKMPLYLGCATCFALPMTLGKLVCGIIGCTRRGRSRILSLLGLAIGAVLLLLLIPAAILSFQQH